VSTGCQQHIRLDTRLPSVIDPPQITWYSQLISTNQLTTDMMMGDNNGLQYQSTRKQNISPQLGSLFLNLLAVSQEMSSYLQQINVHSKADEMANLMFICLLLTNQTYKIKHSKLKQPGFIVKCSSVEK